MPQINLEDLSNIKQLEALFRAQTLMALISGHSSPFHQQHCLMAYACIIRIWQVRFYEIVLCYNVASIFQVTKCNYGASYSFDVLTTSLEFPVL